MPVPTDAIEIVGRRASNAKHYRRPDGRYVAEIGMKKIHASRVVGGPLEDIVLSWRAGPGTNEWISDQNDVRVRTYQTGLSSKPVYWLELTDLSGNGIRFQLDAAPTITSGGKSLTYTRGGATWTYTLTPEGAKLTGPPVSVRLGAQTFAFTFEYVGTPAPLVEDTATGNLTNGTITINRAKVMGANGVVYVARAWTISGTTISFLWDDTLLSASAFPYRVDPTTTFGDAPNVGMVAGDDTSINGQSGTSWPNVRDTTGDIALSYQGGQTTAKTYYGIVSPTYYWRKILLRWDTQSIPDGDLITSATLDVYIPGRGASAADAGTLNFYVQRFTWSGTNGAADHAQTALGDVITPVAFNGTDFAALTSKSFTLANPNTDINKTGYTSFRCTIAKPDLTVPGGFNDLHFATVEDTANPEPRLVVTYTTGDTTPPAAPVMSDPIVIAPPA